MQRVLQLTSFSGSRHRQQRAAMFVEQEGESVRAVAVAVQVEAIARQEAGQELASEVVCSHLHRLHHHPCHP